MKKTIQVLAVIAVVVSVPIFMVVVLVVNASRRVDEDSSFNLFGIFSQAADYDGDYTSVEWVVSECKQNEPRSLELYGGYGGFCGTVKKIRNCYIELHGGEGEFGTDCHVYVNDQSKLAALSKGDDIDFYGRFDGMGIAHLIWRDATLKGSSAYEFVNGEWKRSMD